MISFKNFLTKKPLYVSRPLLNQGELHLWAIEQGFASTSSDIHVTIAYSKTPIRWSTFKEQTDTIRVDGRKQIEKLGSAFALSFDSPVLQQRWREFRNHGASWDHDSYHPHITISYREPRVSINNMKPFNGLLIFGKETFQPLDINWKDKAKNKEY